MSLKTVLRRLELLLFPPICRVCGERQSIFKATLPQPLCDVCSAKLAEQMQAGNTPVLLDELKENRISTAMGA